MGHGGRHRGILVGIPILQCLPHIMMNVRQSEARKKLQFDPLPLTVAFQAVSDDEDDDTLSVVNGHLRQRKRFV
jgi:hypothetical protein